MNVEAGMKDYLSRMVRGMVEELNEHFSSLVYYLDRRDIEALKRVVDDLYFAWHAWRKMEGKKG